MAIKDDYAESLSSFLTGDSCIDFDDGSKDENCKFVVSLEDRSDKKNLPHSENGPCNPTRIFEPVCDLTTNNDIHKIVASTLPVTSLSTVMPTSCACPKISNNSDRLNLLPEFAVSRFQPCNSHAATSVCNSFSSGSGRKAYSGSQRCGSESRSLLKNDCETAHVIFGKAGNDASTNWNSSKSSLLASDFRSEINSQSFQSGLVTKAASIKKCVDAESIFVTEMRTGPSSEMFNSCPYYSFIPHGISQFSTSDSRMGHSVAPRLTGPFPKQGLMKSEGTCNEQDAENVFVDRALGTNTSEVSQCSCIMCYKRKDISNEEPRSSSVEPVLTEQEVRIINGGSGKRKRAKDLEKNNKKRKYKLGQRCRPAASEHPLNGKEKMQSFESFMSDVDIPDDKMRHNINHCDKTCDKTSRKLDESVVIKLQDKSSFSTVFANKNPSSEEQNTIFSSNAAIISLQSNSGDPCSNLVHRINKPVKTLGSPLLGQSLSVFHMSDGPKYKVSPAKVFLKPSGVQLQKGCLFTTVPVSSVLHRNTSEVNIKQNGFPRSPLSTLSVSSPVMVAAPVPSSQLTTESHFLAQSDQAALKHSGHLVSVPQFQQSNETSRKDNQNLHPEESIPSFIDTEHHVSRSFANDVVENNSSGTYVQQNTKSNCKNAGGVIFKFVSHASHTRKPLLSNSLKKLVQRPKILTSVPKTSVYTTSLLRNLEKPVLPNEYAASVSAAFPLSSQSISTYIPYSVTRTSAPQYRQSQDNCTHKNSSNTFVLNQSAIIPATSGSGLVSTEYKEPCCPRISSEIEYQEEAPHDYRQTTKTVQMLQVNSDLTGDVGHTQTACCKENDMGNIHHILQRSQAETDHPHLPEQGLPRTYVADWVTQAQDFNSQQLKGDCILQEFCGVGKPIPWEMSRTRSRAHVLSPHFQPQKGGVTKSKLDNCGLKLDMETITDNTKKVVILPRHKNLAQSVKTRQTSPTANDKQQEPFGVKDANEILQDHHNISPLMLRHMHAYDNKHCDDQKELMGYRKDISGIKSSSSESYLHQTKSVKLSKCSYPSVASRPKGIKLRIRLDRCKRRKARRNVTQDSFTSNGKFEDMGKKTSSTGNDPSIRNKIKEEQPCSVSKLETAEEMFQRCQEQAVQEVFKAQLGVGHISRSLRPTRGTSFVHRCSYGYTEAIDKSVDKVNYCKKHEDAKIKDDLSLPRKKKTEVQQKRRTKKSYQQADILKISVRDYPRLRQDNSITNRKKLMCSDILAGHKVYVKFNTFENIISERSFLVPFFNLGGSRTQFDVEDMEYLDKAVIEFEKDEKSCARHLLFHSRQGNKAAFLRKESLCSTHHLTEKNYKRSSFILEGFKRDTFKQVEVPSDRWKVDNHVDIEIDRAEIDNDTEIEFDASSIGDFDNNMLRLPSAKEVPEQNQYTAGIIIQNSVPKESFECTKLEEQFNSNVEDNAIEGKDSFSEFSPRMQESGKYTEKLQEIIMAENKFQDDKHSNYDMSSFAEMLQKEKQCNSENRKLTFREEPWKRRAETDVDSFIKHEKYGDDYDDESKAENYVSGSCLGSPEKSSHSKNYHNLSCNTIKDEPIDHFFDLPKQRACSLSQIQESLHSDVSTLSQLQSTFCSKALSDSSLELFNSGKSGIDNGEFRGKCNSSDTDNGEEMFIIGSETESVTTNKKENEMESAATFIVDEPESTSSRYPNLTSESELSCPESSLPSSPVSESVRISSASDLNSDTEQDLTDSSSVLAVASPESSELSTFCAGGDQHQAYSKITSLVESLKQRLSQDLPPWLDRGNTSLLHSKIRRKKRFVTRFQPRLKSVEKTSGQSANNLDTTIHASPWTSVDSGPPLLPVLWNGNKSEYGQSSTVHSCNSGLETQTTSVDIPISTSQCLLPSMHSSHPVTTPVLSNYSRSSSSLVRTSVLNTRASDTSCQDKLKQAESPSTPELKESPVGSNELSQFSVTASLTGENEMNMTDNPNTSCHEAKNAINLFGSSKSSGCMERKKIDVANLSDVDIDIGLNDHPETSLGLKLIMPTLEQFVPEQTHSVQQMGLAEEELTDTSSDFKRQSSHSNPLNIRSTRKCSRSRSVPDEQSHQQKRSVAEYLSEKFSLHDGALSGHKIRGPKLLHRTPKNSDTMEKQAYDSSQERSKSVYRGVTLEPISTVELSRSPTISEIFGIAVKNEALSETDQKCQSLVKNGDQNLISKQLVLPRKGTVRTNRRISGTFANDDRAVDSLEYQNARHHISKNKSDEANFTLRPCQVILTKLESLSEPDCKIPSDNYLHSSETDQEMNQKLVESLDVKSAVNAFVSNSTEASVKDRKMMKRRRKRGCKLSRKANNKPKKDIVDYYESVLESLLRKAQLLKEEEAKRNEQFKENKTLDSTELVNHSCLAMEEETDCVEENITKSKQASSGNIEYVKESEKSETVIPLEMDKSSGLKNEANEMKFEVIEKYSHGVGQNNCKTMASNHHEVNTVPERQTDNGQPINCEAQPTFFSAGQINDNCVFRKFDHPCSSCSNETLSSCLEEMGHLDKCEKKLHSKSVTNYDEQPQFDKKDVVLSSNVSEESVLKINGNEEDTGDNFSSIDNESIDECNGSIMSQVEVGQLLGLEAPLNVFELSSEPCNSIGSSDMSNDLSTEGDTRCFSHKIGSGEKLSDKNCRCLHDPDVEEQSSSKLRTDTIQKAPEETGNTEEMTLGNSTCQDKVLSFSSAWLSENERQEQKDKYVSFHDQDKWESVEDVQRDFQTIDHNAKEVNSEIRVSVKAAKFLSSSMKKTKHISDGENQSQHELQPINSRDLGEMPQKVNLGHTGSREQQNDGIFSKLEMLQDSAKPISAHPTEKTNSKSSKNVCAVLKNSFIDINKLKMKLNPVFASKFEKPEHGDSRSNHDADSEISLQLQDRIQRKTSGACRKDLFESKFLNTKTTQSSKQEQHLPMSSLQKLDQSGNVGEKAGGNSGVGCQMGNRALLPNASKLCSMLQHMQKKSNKTTAVKPAASTDWKALNQMNRGERNIHAIVSSTVEKLRRYKNTKKLRSRRKQTPDIILSQEKMDEDGESKSSSLTATIVSTPEENEAYEARGERSFYDCLSHVTSDIWENI